MAANSRKPEIGRRNCCRPVVSGLPTDCSLFSQLDRFEDITALIGSWDWIRKLVQVSRPC